MYMRAHCTQQGHKHSAHTLHGTCTTQTHYTHTLTHTDKGPLVLGGQSLRAAPPRSLVALARRGRAVAGRARRRAPLVARGVDDRRAGLAGGRLRRAGRLILVVLVLVILLGGGRGR